MMSGHSHEGTAHMSAGGGLAAAPGAAGGGGALWNSPGAGSVGDHGHSHSHSGGGGGGGDSCCNDIGSHLTEGFFVARDFRGDVEGEACFTVLLSESESAACVWKEEDRTTQTIKSQLCAKGSSTLSPVVELSSEVLASKDAYKQLLKSVSNSEKRAAVTASSGVQFGASSTASSSGSLSVNVADLLAQDYNATSSYAGADVRPSRNGDRAIITTKSSDGAAVEVGSDELAALLIAHWAAQADEVVEEIRTAGASSGKKGSSSKRKGRSAQASMTLVVPNSFGDAQRTQLSLAAKHLNITVRNIFSRGLAAVAGALFKNGGIDRSVLSTSLAAEMNERRKKAAAGTNAGLTSAIIVYISIVGKSVELSCVRAETRPSRAGGGVSDGGNAKNTMGFDRLVSLAHLGFAVDAEEGQWPAGAVDGMMRNLLARVPTVNKSDVAAVLYDCTEASLQSVKTFLRSSDSASKLIAVRSQPSDAVRGGCLLSAAELQSAKEFVHNSTDDSWGTEFNLAVGEENSGGAIAVTTSTTGDISAKDIKEPPTEILPAQTRLYKPDVGPATSKSALTQKLEHTSTFKSDRSALTYSASADSVGTSAVVTMQVWQQEVVSPVKVSDLAASSATLTMRWRQLTVVRPLIGEDTQGVASDMTSADVTITMLPRLGHQSVAIQQGVSLRDARRSYWGYIKSLSFFVVMLLLVGAYFLFQRFEKDREHQVLVDWLTDFYQKHAPEKLQDPEFVEKTLAKYSNKIFVLWRQLERTYKVKFDPPSVILEDSEF